jgi:hypothetical protein
MSRTYTSALVDLPDPVGFTLDGQEYTCRELGPLELSEIARMHGTAADSPSAVAFMAEFFESILGHDQYRQFRERCQQFNTGPETLVEVIQGIFEDFTARPTAKPGDSSPGSPATPEKLRDGSSDPVLERLRGRPDLAQAVLGARDG